MEKNINIASSEQSILAEAGYGPAAIQYFLEKKYMGSMENASCVSKKVGSCGDIMKIYIKADESEIIEDVRYEISGCAGAISAAMATVDLVRGKSLDQALEIDDGHVFQQLEGVPEKKHHCIQLAVKTLHQGVNELKAAKQS